LVEIVSFLACTSFLAISVRRPMKAKIAAAAAMIGLFGFGVSAN
jgi:hypothetical protein